MWNGSVITTFPVLVAFFVKRQQKAIYHVNDHVIGPHNSSSLCQKVKHNMIGPYISILCQKVKHNVTGLHNISSLINMVNARLLTALYKASTQI